LIPQESAFGALSRRKGWIKSLPLTGVGCVTKIVTNLAVLEVTDKGFKLLERAPGVSVEEIKEATEGTLIVEGEIPEMAI
jgi:3-oxoacid CoA-transferase subunit B